MDGVPQRRIVELARWGMAGKAPALRRHPQSRKLATLLATVVYLEAKATDDALKLFDVLMTNELMARALRESKKQTLRRYPRVSRDAATCAAAVGVLLESVDRGDDVTLQALWDAIETVVSRSALRTAVANIAAVLPPPDSRNARGDDRAETDVQRVRRECGGDRDVQILESWLAARRRCEAPAGGDLPSGPLGLAS